MILIHTLNEFLKALPHDVDITDTHELKFDVLVEGFVLVSFAGSTVHHRVDLKTD